MPDAYALSQEVFSQLTRLKDNLYKRERGLSLDETRDLAHTFDHLLRQFLPVNDTEALEEPEEVPYLEDLHPGMVAEVKIEIPHNPALSGWQRATVTDKRPTNAQEPFEWEFKTVGGKWYSGPEQIRLINLED